MDALVGRERERGVVAAVLDGLRGGAGGIVVIEGEPGIGKSRLLAHLAAEAQATVLRARASEYEADLPYALWTDALDRHMDGLGERARSRLGMTDPDALAAVLPSLGAAGGEVGRHRTHRALRDLLERLAATRALVLCLDDVHWADPASAEALAALAYRPPDAPVLLAIATRPGQTGAALLAAEREGRVTRLVLEPLSEAEARELVGDRARDVYDASGGNPFYLEQLARVQGDVPPTVAAAIAAELAALDEPARRLLDAAAVAGDPFDAGLAAHVAELEEPAALAALDELLRRTLVRPRDAPRRFAFRHPVVRHTVYEAAPAGRRLGAHALAAAELERRGAGPVALAHHVEQAAEPGDEPAIELLSAAARELMAPAPGTAARFLAAALRLLPDGDQRATALRARLADAQAADGDAAAARATLLRALETAAPEDRLVLTVGIANAEWWLGRTEDARRRLHVALGALPAEPSPDRIRLRLALALTSLMACDLAETLRQTADAAADARAIGDPVFEAAALSAGAIAAAASGEDEIGPAAAALDALTGAQRATRLPAYWMLGRARRLLGDHERALEQLEAGTAIAIETGRDNVRLQLAVETAVVLIELGRLREAVAAAEQGVELARLAGNARTLLWARCALAMARLAVGDVAAAVRHATEAADTGAEADFHAAGQPGWALGAALTAAGEPERAVPHLRDALAAALPAERAAVALDLAEAERAAGDAITDGTAEMAGTAETAGTAGTDGTDGTADMAGAPATVAPAGPFAAARARLEEGRALAAAGRRTDAIEALTEAEAAFERMGAQRRRDEAIRELRRLGHRVVRAARAPGGEGPLTAREREIAELVAAGRTNREIAGQLVLSLRTVEAHLRNVYGKLGVRSRVELTRALDDRRR